jgi:hypothetical protein
MKIHKLLALCAAFVAMCTSCEHKELCYNHPHNGRVTVVFDWRYAADANPSSMSLYLFPKNGGSVQRYDFARRDGGPIEVLEGEYTAVCINSDTRYTMLDYTGAETTSYSSADLLSKLLVESETSSKTSRLSTISESAAMRAPRAEGTEDERVIYAPEAVWTDTNGAVVIENITVAGEQVLTMYPQQAYCKYTVQMTDINNCENVVEMSATISSMAEGVFAATQAPTGNPVTIPFAVTVDRDNAAATGIFNTFGHCPEGETHTHTVLIYAVMSDGAKYYTTVDVTDQVHNAPDPRNVVITIDNVDLPNPVIAGGNESVSVEDWENFVIDVLF